MIDDKKIEAAANKHIETEYARYNSGEVEEEMICHRGKDSFKAGAKWMQEEFLKNLWHPANEKPKRRCNYLLLHYKDKEEECFEADVVDTKAWDCYIKGSLVEYINIDDLFSKEGGEQ
jgi:hypothetical protein